MEEAQVAPWLAWSWISAEQRTWPDLNGRAVWPPRGPLTDRLSLTSGVAVAVTVSTTVHYSKLSYIRTHRGVGSILRYYANRVAL